MVPTLTIDVTSVCSQLAATIKSCLNSVREDIKEEIEHERAPVTKAEAGNIEGLREQILANATVLLTMLRPDAVTKTTVNGHLLTELPKLHVIVSGQPNGQEAFTKAYVLYDQDDSPKKAKFLYTDDPSITVAEALHKLLGVSAQLIERNLFATGLNLTEGTAIAVTGGGWCSPGGQHSPVAETDFKFWNQKSDSGSPTTSFSTDSSSGSTYASTEYAFARNPKRADSGIDVSDNRSRAATPSFSESFNICFAPCSTPSFASSFARADSSVSDGNFDMSSFNRSFGFVGA
ncbi:hypothetical protein LTR56_016975 [Elasticomyces elasticus]|nr:hypothetical protein LTR22_027392 [Elasticomyces elasticus]KAK3631200.1 hypothetical protein LTR56_016975 [Elasticomyces elasticus]KAK4915337.1 hypothetical protein LTR49_016468 [Elasticomyces elasticus]KAK5753664.1 hypothetical protein LTS12_016301 [Elasticomyces elasticus]